jgi:PST family polysaccharide transporter
MSDLTQTATKGTAWNTAASLARIASALLILPILTRLLDPADFGILAVGMPVVLFMMLFNDMGIGPALVRADNPSKGFWSTAFFTNLLMGTLLTCLVFATAGLAADVFRLPRAEPILQALAFALILNCFSVVPGAWLLRKFDFRALAIIEIVSSFAGIAVAIYTAYEGAGAWALVWQQLTMFALKSLMLWLRARVPLAFTFDWNEIKAVLPFISNLLSSQVINFFARNSDNFIIARVLGETALGFYSIAYRIMLLPIQFFAWGIASVLLPTLSTFKTDLPRVKKACLRVFRIIALITFPAMAGIAALSEPIISFVLGSKMLPAAPVLAILAPIGAFQSLSSSQGAMFMTLGRTDILLRYTILTTIVVLIAFLIGTRYGLVGTAIAYLIGNMILVVPIFRSLLGLMDGTLKDMWGAVGMTGINATLMGALVYLLADHYRFTGATDFNILLVCIPAGGLIYGTLLLLTDRRAFPELFDLGRKAIT